MAQDETPQNPQISKPAVLRHDAKSAPHARADPRTGSGWSGDRGEDSRSGMIITAKVLAQILLELDTAKLAVFPGGSFHRLIRANEQIIEEFTEKYFNRALTCLSGIAERIRGLLEADGGFGPPARPQNGCAKCSADARTSPPRSPARQRSGAAPQDAPAHERCVTSKAASSSSARSWPLLSDRPRRGDGKNDVLCICDNFP